MCNLKAVFQADDGVINGPRFNVLLEAFLQQLSIFSGQSLPTTLLLKLRFPHHVRAEKERKVRNKRSHTAYVFVITNRLSKHKRAAPCDPYKGNLLAAAVVDQRDAHIL